MGWLLLAAPLGGLLAIAVVQGLFGALDGDWLVNAGVVSLGVLAVATTITGLAAALGHPGLALGVLTMILIGSPWSAAASAPELLPDPAGAVGQLLPPGAMASLLRSEAFFDGAGAAGPLTVLLVWIAAGAAAAASAGYARASSQATMSPST